MREVTEQLWRAGKYAAVGIVVFVTLPLSVPSVFILSVLLFTIVLPLLCAVAGFLFLQRHAKMLYRYLPGVRRASGADPSHRRFSLSSRSGGIKLLELLSKDANRIDSFEVVDEEFDAVLVNTVPDFEKPVLISSPQAHSAQQLESRKDEEPELQRDEAGQIITTADSSVESRDVQQQNVDRDGCHDEAVARDALRRDGRQERQDDEQELSNAEEMSLSDDKFRNNNAALALSSGNLEQYNRELQFNGTVPGNSGVEGAEGVQGRMEEKEDFGNVTDRDDHEGKLATASESSKDITSEDSCAGHPEVVPTEQPDLNLVSPSGASRPESAPLNYAPLEMSRPDESDQESFKSTSAASFEAPQSEKESDFEDGEEHHSVESFDGDDDRDDSSLSDEDSYHYEAPQKVDRGGETVFGAARSRSALSCPAEGICGYPSTTSRESDASEEKEGTMKSSRSGLELSEDMYDSEEQMHLQQVHSDEERQLREELKAIKTIVGDDGVSRGPLVSEIEELSEILGIELPSLRDIPELEWANVAVGVMKVVVGVD